MILKLKLIGAGDAGARAGEIATLQIETVAPSGGILKIDSPGDFLKWALGTLADWKPGYTSELESVISKRCTEVFGDEYNRVLKKEKVVPLRMNPEAKYEGGILQRLTMLRYYRG